MLPRSPFVFLCAALLMPAAARAAQPSPPNEIVVSAANYAHTPPEVLEKMFRQPAELTDTPAPDAATARPVQYYQFLKGEIYEADLKYEDVCQLLVPALASKNLRNTFDQSKVEFILRVSFGSRRWRDPFVREDHLEWRHGLVPRKVGTSLSAAQAWDDRAGGDESALRQTEQTLTDMYGASAEGMADRLIKGVPTEDYFLVVVDAFEVATLKTKGNNTPRAWTTFIAVRQRDRAKFSDVAAAMIARAAPFFGETLPGKAHFTDREGKVTPGELRVVEENVPEPKR